MRTSPPRSAPRPDLQSQRANGGSGCIREIAPLTESGGELENQEQGIIRLPEGAKRRNRVSHHPPGTWSRP